MIVRILQLFKIARKLSASGALETINQIYKVPFILKLFFELLSIGAKKAIIQQSKRPGEKLCDALEGMGTTFIKLGQFLATRPDIIGEELTKNLEKLQDKLPPFSKSLAENIIRDELGELLEFQLLNK